MYIKSPMNYIGGKYKLLPQLMQEFPEEIGIFVDLFCGGLDVSINMVGRAKKVISNDIQKDLIEMYKGMQTKEKEEVIKRIESCIEEYGLLTRDNPEGFKRLREKVNKGEKVSEEFFTLVAYSFNSQIRYNQRGEYNTSYGKHKGHFNQVRKKNMERLLEVIKGVEFISKDFREYDYSKLKEGDFVYIDPPYLITEASYQSYIKWGEEEEKSLLKLCDTLDKRGVRFGLSNVIESKGKENKILKEWSKSYRVVEIEKDYRNCNYHRKRIEGEVIREVYITNYEKSEKERENGYK